ncbi:hypothetical protein C1645_822638 [Glomus cerebriforme]|uniref:Uncharacterized protein n=1 Tax=Glomus cerebriforme TaxID=658196 RepID=A0A397SZG4_9GLOM|nr:hypothetical protein C1645_822638 [Glomus cerebriforme]
MDDGLNRFHWSIPLYRKDQIKSVIVVKCLYSYDEKTGKNSSKTKYVEKYHRGGMQPIFSEGEIDKHITITAKEIDKQAYTYHRATGGSFKPTPKRLTNIKCTINPDNQDLIDPKTNKLSEEYI